MRYGGSYAPYFGNLYEPSLPAYYGPYYNGGYGVYGGGNYGPEYANGYGDTGCDPAAVQYPAGPSLVVPEGVMAQPTPAETPAKPTGNVLPMPAK